jgi:hypothetical protein
VVLTAELVLQLLGLGVVFVAVFVVAAAVL